MTSSPNLGPSPASPPQAREAGAPSGPPAPAGGGSFYEGSPSSPVVCGQCRKCGAMWLGRSRTVDADPSCWSCGLVTYRTAPARYGRGPRGG